MDLEAYKDPQKIMQPNSADLFSKFLESVIQSNNASNSHLHEEGSKCIDACIEKAKALIHQANHKSSIWIWLAIY